MSSTPAEKEFLSFAEAAEKILFYFHETIKYLAPISEPDEDPTPPAKALKSAAQNLMEKIVRELHWFRDRNQFSADQIRELDQELARLQVATNHTESGAERNQGLTIDHIKKKIGEASQIYGQEGLEWVLQLQETMIKLHKEVVLPTEENISKKLILHDKNKSQIEEQQVLLSESPSIMFMKVIHQLELRKCSHMLDAIEMQSQAERAALEKFKMQGNGIKNAEVAISNCHKPLEDMKEAMFISLAQQVETVGEPGQPITYQHSLGILRSNLGKITDLQQHFGVQLGEFLNEITNPDHGLVKSPIVVLIENFYKETKDVSKYIGSLLSVKQIIREKHQDNFIENIVKITKEFSDILVKVKNMFTSWSQYAGQGASEAMFFKLKEEAAALTGSFMLFDREIRKCIHEITRILERKHDKSNSKRLQKWQKDGDRVHMGQNWAGRSLATTLEAKKDVQKLEGVTNAILTVSNWIMPLTSECGGLNLPTGERSGREVLQAVPESLLTMISTALFAESITLKGFNSKESVQA